MNFELLELATNWPRKLAGFSCPTNQSSSKFFKQNLQPIKVSDFDFMCRKNCLEKISANFSHFKNLHYQWNIWNGSTDLVFRIYGTCFRTLLEAIFHLLLHFISCLQWNLFGHVQDHLCKEWISIQWNNLSFKRPFLIRNVAQGAVIKIRKGIKSFKFQFLMMFHVMTQFQRSPRHLNDSRHITLLLWKFATISRYYSLHKNMVPWWECIRAKNWYVYHIIYLRAM